jgi:hypothetical protein
MYILFSINFEACINYVSGLLSESKNSVCLSPLSKKENLRIKGYITNIDEMS